MAGIYNYHPNIAHPGAFIHNQMASQQAPFFMGGSQVPVNLGLKEQYEQPRGMEGQGFKKTTHSLFRRRGNLIPSSQLRK
jgi:hypothetical protein